IQCVSAFTCLQPIAGQVFSKPPDLSLCTVPCGKRGARVAIFILFTRRQCGAIFARTDRVAVRIGLAARGRDGPDLRIAHFLAAHRLTEICVAIVILESRQRFLGVLGDDVVIACGQRFRARHHRDGTQHENGCQRCEPVSHLVFLQTSRQPGSPNLKTTKRTSCSGVKCVRSTVKVVGPVLTMPPAQVDGTASGKSLSMVMRKSPIGPFQLAPVRSTYSVSVAKTKVPSLPPADAERALSRSRRTPANPFWSRQ